MDFEHLSRYDRATVGLWSRSHAELARPSGVGQAARDRDWLVEAAVHAVLAGLGDCGRPGDLLSRYEADAAGDLALVGSLVGSPRSFAGEPGEPGEPGDIPYRVREAAFHLRWRELTATG
jgi:hypothetical protein